MILLKLTSVAMVIVHGSTVARCVTCAKYHRPVVGMYGLKKEHQAEHICQRGLRQNQNQMFIIRVLLFFFWWSAAPFVFFSRTAYLWAALHMHTWCCWCASIDIKTFLHTSSHSPKTIALYNTNKSIRTGPPGRLYRIHSVRRYLLADRYCTVFKCNISKQVAFRRTYIYSSVHYSM